LWNCTPICQGGAAIAITISTWCSRRSARQATIAIIHLREFVIAGIALFIMRMPKVGGIILCGGQSKRMGKPKAWLPIGGKIMLPRVVGLLGEAVSPIVVVAAQEQNLPPLPSEVKIVRDEEQGRGPLQGLAAGLAAFESCVDAAYASSCDAPFLRPAFVRRMIELLGDRQICVPLVGAYHHPLAAVYRLEVLDAVRKLLSGNCLRPSFLFDAVPTRVAQAEELSDVDPAFETLRNLNTPEDYEQAVRDAASL
jgi:molybdenum cofactor guanylyltransferase